MTADFLTRFFGQVLARPGGPPVANTRIEQPPSLQVVFDEVPEYDADVLTLALRSYHPELSAATVEFHASPRKPEPGEEESPPDVFGLFGWSRHVVKLIGFNSPMPKDVLEACVRPAHYEDEVKQLAYSHAAHAILYYAGYDGDPLEQYVAVAAVAGCLARFGAVAVLNETAHTSVPAVVLLPDEADDLDILTAIRGMPLPFLFAGFVKLEIEGDAGIWMRTYGAHVLGLPDLAFRADGHHQGTFAFHAFANMLAYLRESGKSFLPGDTMQVGEKVFLTLRERTESEWYLESDGEMLVCETGERGA
jgi:hypothetical protein